MIKMLKEKDRVNNPLEELGLIVDTIRKTMEVKAKTIKIKKINKDEKRYGLLDSGATNNVREVKKRESLKGLAPIEVEIAFDSDVKADLFMNPEGTIIGPEGTPKRLYRSMNQSQQDTVFIGRLKCTTVRLCYQMTCV